MEILSFFEKLLENKHWPFAVFGAGVTILWLNDIGWLASAHNDDAWVPMLTVLAGWFVVTILFQAWFAPFQERRREAKKKAEADRLIASHRRGQQSIQMAALATLDDEQKVTLWFVKKTGNPLFQAWDNDDEISALLGMAIIEHIARSNPNYSLYRVPQHIWDALILTEEQLDMIRPEAPWERRLKTSSYRI